MPLPFEKFKELRSQGLSVEQIQKFERGEKPKPVSKSPFNPNTPGNQFVQPTPAGATEMQYRPEDKTGVTAGNFVKALPSAALQVGVGSPIKLLTSVGEGTVSTLTGKSATGATGKTYDLPGLAPFKSFQSEAAERAKQGQNPLANVAQGAFDAGVAGLDTIGLAKGATKAPSALKAVQTSRAAATEKKLLAEALDLTKPVVNKKLAINTLKQSGKANAGAQEVGFLKKVVPQSTSLQTEIADSVKGLVSKTNSPVRNISNINDEITRISESELLPALKANNVSLVRPTVVNRLNQIEPTKLIKSDATLNNTYSQVKDLMFDKIAENSSSVRNITSEGLWNARKAFDSAVEEQFGDAIYDPIRNSAVKQAIRDVRTKVNDIIAEVNSDFRPQLKRLSNMYSARDTIAERNYKLLAGEANRITAFAKNHPKLTKTAKAGATLIGGGAAAKYFLGD